jgi:A/G-specific adenine glycosylase
MGATERSLARDLIAWAEDHPRPMPWKRTKDPYKIWLSEIILQQTQVAQGIPYYKEFIRKFPTVRHLAKASEDEVLRAWQGLGYNSRARNLHHAARTIVTEYSGVFPTNYDEILALKGVGEYTAAAVASFAFGHPTPVLDSNVIRVVSRVFGIAGLATDKSVRQTMYRQLESMLVGQDPAVFLRAIEHHRWPLQRFLFLRLTPKGKVSRLDVRRGNCGDPSVATPGIILDRKAQEESCRHQRRYTC